MGCDIHTYVERKHRDKWVYISYDVPSNRSYKAFSQLANVRGYIDDTCEPKGLPEDVSDSVQYFSDQLGDDGHSHSYTSLKNYLKIYRDSSFDLNQVATDRMLTPSEQQDYDKYILEHSNPFTEWNEEEQKYSVPWDELRVVFWFDN